MASGQRLAVIEFHIIEPLARTLGCKPAPSLSTKSLLVALPASSCRSTIWDTKAAGTQKLSKASIKPETPEITKFQAQKKTSVDVFRCKFGGPG
jgi:hypothetical protein